MKTTSNIGVSGNIRLNSKTTWKNWSPLNINSRRIGRESASGGIKDWIARRRGASVSQRTGHQLSRWSWGALFSAGQRPVKWGGACVGCSSTATGTKREGFPLTYLPLEGSVTWHVVVLFCLWFKFNISVREFKLITTTIMAFSCPYMFWTKFVHWGLSI